MHIEMTNNLTTDSFIQVLRQLISRRGNITMIWSDNGIWQDGWKNDQWFLDGIGRRVDKLEM